MTQRIYFAKDRQKFAAAHFTVFPDGSVERLHGHNYQVAVAFEGDRLELGLLAPFHILKKAIDEVCMEWDEVVLLPTECPWGTVRQVGTQVEFALATPKVSKLYSFPREDVVLLPVDNISCENLALTLAGKLRTRIEPAGPVLRTMEVTVAESSGQSVTSFLPIP